jgi:5,10-methylenetetrahydromethanopterin reductase
MTLRQPRGTALALRDPFAWDDLVGLVREAETLGYTGLFLPEIAGRDAFATLTGIAGETHDLMLATGIVPMTSRRAFTTAMGAATVQERSGGRMVLGLGTGHAAAGALRDLRAQIVALRLVLGGGKDPGSGQRLSLALPAPVPVWVSALGPRAVETAGELADGVLLNWCTPERVGEARLAVRAVAAAAGRDPDQVTIAVYVRGSLGADEEAARLALKTAAGEYAGYPPYARQFAAMGLAEGAGAAARASGAARPADVPDDFVDAICLPGEAKAASARLEAFRAAGADVVVVYPVAAGPDPASSVDDTLRALAPSGG